MLKRSTRIGSTPTVKPEPCTGPKCTPTMSSIATFPISIIVYFVGAFIIGVASSILMTEKETPWLLSLVELLIALTIVGFGHKFFTMLTPGFIDSPSANVIFAFVAINANGKVGSKVKKVASFIPKY